MDSMHGCELNIHCWLCSESLLSYERKFNRNLPIPPPHPWSRIGEKEKRTLIHCEPYILEEEGPYLPPAFRTFFIWKKIGILFVNSSVC